MYLLMWELKVMITSGRSDFLLVSSSIDEELLWTAMTMTTEP